MAHTALDSSFSIWFSSAVNAVVSSAQRSCSLLHYFPSPQGWGMVCPQECILNPSAVCFPKGAPVLLGIWSLELPVWNLNSQQLVLTVCSLGSPRTFLGGERKYRGRSTNKNKNLSLWLIGWKDVSNSNPLNWMWAQIKKSNCFQNSQIAVQISIADCWPFLNIKWNPSCTCVSDVAFRNPTALCWRFYLQDEFFWKRWPDFGWKFQIMTMPSKCWQLSKHFVIRRDLKIVLYFRCKNN